MKNTHFCKYLAYVSINVFLKQFSSLLIDIHEDQTNRVNKKMTKDGSIKIVISMTTWAGGLVLGPGHIRRIVKILLKLSSLLPNMDQIK